MGNIVEAFEQVDFDCFGALNNIKFFVFWRDLEFRWRRQGIVVRPHFTDAELVKLFNVYADYNSETDGITLDDFFECRATVNKGIANRHGQGFQH